MEYPEKTTDLPQDTDKLYHKKLYWVHFNMGGNRTHNLSKEMHWLHRKSDYHDTLVYFS
jgi:hypothetical protein